MYLAISLVDSIFVCCLYNLKEYLELINELSLCPLLLSHPSELCVYIVGGTVSSTLWLNAPRSERGENVFFLHQEPLVFAFFTHLDMSDTIMFFLFVHSAIS